MTWTRDGEEVVPDDTHLIVSEGTMHTLTISKAQLTDEADYAVTAGDAKTSATLWVEGRCTHPESSHSLHSPHPWCGRLEMWDSSLTPLNIHLSHKDINTLKL